jgi:hypothetical protein
MLMLAIGIVIGLVWATAGCMTMIIGGWTGPFFLGLLLWPALLATDAYYDWRDRRANR